MAGTEPRVVALTHTQADVVRELAHDGAGNVEIADRLGITHHTVKTHLAKAMDRIGIHNRTELAVALLRRRVVIQRVNKSR